MTRAKAKPGRSQLATKRRAPLLLLCAALSVTLLLGYSWLQTDQQNDPGTVDEQQVNSQIVSIGYRVDPREWPGRRPTLCEVVDHYALGAPARAATLHLNAQNGDCATADRRVGLGERVPIAVWVAPDFPLCRREAASCR